MSKYKKYILLYLLFLMYSFSTILSKLASNKPFLSWQFICLYGGVLFILGLYAILWQQILKYFKLNVAYANKAVVIVFGLIWGYFLFDENITIYKIVGALTIIVGVCLVVNNNE